MNAIVNDEIKIFINKKRVQFEDDCKQHATNGYDDTDGLFIDLVNKIRKKHRKSEQLSAFSASQKLAKNHYGPTIVKSKIVFSRIGYIDTKRERFDSEVYIENEWHDNELFDILLNLDGYDDVADGRNHSLPIFLQVNIVYNNLKKFLYDPQLYWHPKIYVENAIGDLKQDICYSLKIAKKFNSSRLLKQHNPFTICVKETRFIKGWFYEKLELNDFPMDLQELSITLSSQYDNNTVKFLELDNEPSTVSTKLFLSQQEWDLFGHVKTKTKSVFDTWTKHHRSQFTATAFIARKPGYYINNAYFLVFLVTVLGFIPFSINLKIIFARSLVTGVLILTSVNLRWIISQRIPYVPYLTSIDRYSIGCLCFLVSFSVWHCIVSSDFLNETDEARERADMYTLIGFAVIFLIYNLSYGLWFFRKFRRIRLIKLNKKN